jgi:hypothetical protein
MSSEDLEALRKFKRSKVNVRFMNRRCSLSPALSFSPYLLVIYCPHSLLHFFFFSSSIHIFFYFFL